MSPIPISPHPEHITPRLTGHSYYFTNNTGDEKITAFPKGFRMIAGDTSMRNTTLPQPEPEMSFWTGSELTQFGLAQKSIGFNCLHYQVAPNEGSLEHHYMRDKAFLDANCFDGLRFELMFPSCWDGKNIDSPNHKDHILYPELRKTGACPDGFPVKMPQLFYETIYDTYSFRNESGTFILANGDPTGYGYHGDFMAGWDPDFLQHTIDTCRNDSGLQEDCHLFDLQDDANATSCTLPLPEELLHEDYPGPREGLPGNILIQSGPEYAQEFPGTPLSAVSSLPSSEPSPANHSNVATTSNSTPSKSSSSSIATTSASTCETPPPPAIAAPPSVSLVYSTITSNSAIVDLVIVEEEVTVTVTTSALETGDMLRRHLGKHQHHHHQQRH